MQIQCGGRRYDAETGQLAVEKGLMVLLDKDKTSKNVDRTSKETNRASEEREETDVFVYILITQSLSLINNCFNNICIFVQMSIFHVNRTLRILVVIKTKTECAHN